MSETCYLRTEFINKLYPTFKLYEYRFSNHRASKEINGYIDRVIPDQITTMFLTRKFNSIDEKIVYFMNSKHRHLYSMSIHELQEIAAFILTFRRIMSSSCSYVKTEIIDLKMANITLDVFSLKANVTNELKKLKIYKDIDKEDIYHEPQL